MKILHLLFVFTLLIPSQKMQAQNPTSKRACFVTKINIQNATKDGIYLNGYVVNIPYTELIKLNGKNVRISGKVTVVKERKHYKDGVARQGREEDAKHILKPKIKVLFPRNVSQ
jgi:hypothetical protein